MSAVDLSAEGWSAWPAPAKLNLFLQIVGRREDGYHLLQTVFQLLEWGDVIHLRPREDGVILRVGESTYGVAAEHDLVVRAAISLKKSTNSDQGVDIFVEKKIPAGGAPPGPRASASASRPWTCRPAPS